MTKAILWIFPDKETLGKSIADWVAKTEPEKMYKVCGQVIRTICPGYVLMTTVYSREAVQGYTPDEIWIHPMTKLNAQDYFELKCRAFPRNADIHYREWYNDKYFGSLPVFNSAAKPAESPSVDRKELE